MSTLADLLVDGDSALLVAEALDYYRGLIESNRETAVSDDEAAFFTRTIAAIDVLLEAVHGDAGE